MDAPVEIIEAKDEEKVEEVDVVEGSGDRAVEGSGDRVVGGSTLSEDVEGETPADGGVEGDVHVDKGEEDVGNDESTEEEIPEESEAGEREEEIVDGVDVESDKDGKDDMDVDGPELSDRPEHVEGTKYIVVPDEEPETEVTPTKARANRRSARVGRKLEKERTSTRSMELVDSDNDDEEWDDLEKTPQTEEIPGETGEETPQAEEMPEETGDEIPQTQEILTEEEHYAKERKRKGKQEAAPPKKD